MNRIKNMLYLSLGALLWLSGCATTMAPEYSQPAAPVPNAWPSGPAYKVETAKADQKPLAEIPWQEFFVEPQLQKLIALALDNNRDLRVSILNMERFRAQYQIRRADLFPNMDATAGATYQRIPEDFSATGKAATVHQYDVGLGVSSYEVDLFGRVRSLKDQALEQYLSTEQARRSVQISLVSQVATAYLTLPPTWNASSWPRTPWPTSRNPSSLPRAVSTPAFLRPWTCNRLRPAWMLRGWTLPASPPSPPRT